jgi:hypothetical protein
MMKVGLLLFALPLAGAQLLCARDALSMSAPAYLTSQGAINSWQGNQGSATFVFETQSASATFWAKTLCPDGSSDSWRVNGRVWHIPTSTDYQWHEFGDPTMGPEDPTTTVTLVARESNCRIQQVYFGTQGNLLQNDDMFRECGRATDNGYRCPSSMSISSPVFLDDNDDTFISSPSGSLGGPGMAHVSFDHPSSFGAANLWFRTQCETSSSDSWYIDGTVWHVPQSSTPQWHMVGEFNTNSFTLKPREGDCKISAAYFGRDTPSDDGDFDNCDANPFGMCVSQASSYEGNIMGLWAQAMHGQCRSSMTNPPAECDGSATFDFGTNRGTLWALTQCSGGSSDSWYVNGNVWHVPHTAIYTWHRVGDFPGDRHITFKVREPNCNVQMLFRGYNPAMVGAMHQRCTPLSFLDFKPTYPVQKPNHRNHMSWTKLIGTDGNNLAMFGLSGDGSTLFQRLECKYKTDNANGIAIDSSGGFYVADSQASRLYWFDSACTEKKVLIRSVDALSNIGNVEILHTHGVLIVSTWSQPAIYYVSVNADHEIENMMNTGATQYHTHGLTECVDSHGNDGFLFVEQGNYLMFYDVVKKQRTTVLSPASGVVDIGDVEYHSCGLYFTANDNNQLWVCNHDEQGTNVASCTEPMANCRRACGPLVDGSTCMDLKNPNGLAVDCNCNVYVGNKGNGNLVSYVNQLDLGLVLNNDAYLNDVEVCGPATCSDPAPVGQSCGAVNGGGQSATTGDVVTWVVSASEPVARPSFITCAVGSTALNFQWSSADTFAETHVASYQVQASDPSGEILCTFGPLVDALGQTSEITASPNNDCRVVIGASPSNTPSRSPSPSPSVSPPPEYSLQVEMHFESGECATEGCVNDDALDNVTIRMSSSVAKVKAVETSELGQCASDGGTPTPSGQSFFCFFFLAFTDLHRWDISDFTIFRLTANGPPPGFHVSPDIFPANTYPNTVATTQSRASVAAAVNCEGLPSAAPLRWTWLRKADQGPCYFDPELNNFELCSPAGKDLNNEDYSDISGAVLPTDAIFKDVFCPT